MKIPELYQYSMTGFYWDCQGNLCCPAGRFMVAITKTEFAGMKHACAKVYKYDDNGTRLVDDGLELQLHNDLIPGEVIREAFEMVTKYSNREGV